MSKSDLLEIIKEKYTISIDENKINSYQELLDLGINLKQIVDEIYSELKFNLKVKNDKLINILFYLDKLDYSPASCKLGLCYLYGYSRRSIWSCARKYILKAAEKDDAEACLIYSKEFWTNLEFVYPNDEKFLEKTNDNHNYWLHRAAVLGNEVAQYEFGRLYTKSSSTFDADYKTAIEWYTLSANQNYVPAQLTLAKLYEEGRFVTQDYDKALYWYEQASNHSKVAQQKLALIYYEGTLVKQDFDKALEIGVKSTNDLPPRKPTYTKDIYFMLADIYINQKATSTKEYDHQINITLYKIYLKSAALLGHIEAEYLLGKEYYEGKVWDKNYNECIKWLNTASDDGHKEAKLLLVKIYFEEFKSCKSKIRKEELCELIINVYFPEAKKGEAEYEWLLGEIYYKIFDTIQYKYNEEDNAKMNLEQAIYWLTKAADKYHNEAMLLLGKIYYQQREDKKAVQYLSLVTENGNFEANYLLGIICRNHRLYKRAINFFLEVLESDFAIDAAFELGRIYEKGLGVEVDFEKAKEYYELMASLGAVNTICLDLLLEKMKKN